MILPERPYITSAKEQNDETANLMGRLIKYLMYIVILACLALVAYAYLGPWFGADFAPPQSEIRKPVILDAD